MKRLKDLEAENARLRRAVADLTPDKQIPAEAARETIEPRAPARLRRARAADAVRLRAPRLRGARPAPPDAAQGAAGPRGRDDEERLTADIVEPARRYGRYG